MPSFTLEEEEEDEEDEEREVEEGEGEEVVEIVKQNDNPTLRSDQLAKASYSQSRNKGRGKGEISHFSKERNSSIHKRKKERRRTALKNRNAIQNPVPWGKEARTE